MELSQIKYFIMAAQVQNFSKAAQLLNITQPALSKSIINLEAELGIRLFDRSGKKIVLNERGSVFYEYAMNSVQELDDAVSAARSQTAGSALRIGIFHHSEKFMRCLGMYKKVEPTVTVQLEYLEIVPNNIYTDKYDMILYPRNPLLAKYKGDVVYSDPYYLAVHKSSPLTKNETVRMSDIAGQKLVIIKYGNKLFDVPFNYHTGTEHNLGGEILTNSYEIQRWLVSNNFGVGFIPLGAAGAYAADKNITLIPIAGDEFSCEILIGFRREKHLSADGRRFAAFVRDYFGTL